MSWGAAMASVQCGSSGHQSLLRERGVGAGPQSKRNKRDSMRVDSSFKELTEVVTWLSKMLVFWVWMVRFSPGRLLSICFYVKCGREA